MVVMPEEMKERCAKCSSPNVICLHGAARLIQDAQAEQRRKVFERVLWEIERCPDFGRIIAKDFKADIMERVQYLKDQPDAILTQEEGE